jgi:inner membrane transporter RhtA
MVTRMLRGKQGKPAQGCPAGVVRWPVARLPPSSFFLVSAVFHYLGPSLAVLLFLRVPVLGMAWLRIVSAAVVFALWRRPWRLIPRLDRAQRTVLVQLGVVLAAMNSLFYLALARLPLSTVGAVEFLGTVLLAASAARSRRNVLALALTTIGVAAITDVRLAGQPLGFLYAFGNCVLFMCYVILGHRIATPRAATPRAATPRAATPRAATRRVGGPQIATPRAGSAGYTQAAALGGIDLLAASMLIAAVVVTPAGLGGALRAFGHPVLLLAAAGVGVCSSVIPYVTDQLAMARLPRASFALMLALLPMFATVIGAIVLRQFPTRQDLLGIGLVIIGVAVHKVHGPTTNEENTHALYPAGLVRPERVPDLPGHDELRHYDRTPVAPVRGRRRADRGAGGGGGRGVLRYRRHLLRRRD